jgi:hypothetical protein
MPKEYMECPICRGRGDIVAPESSRLGMMDLKRNAAKVLRQSGYGIRQIQRLLGYKSPRSASLLVKSL